MKKWKPVVLAVMLMSLLLGMHAMAASDPQDFVIENGQLTEYTGDGGEVIIPDGVTSIGKYAFSGHSGLTDVIIPDSVKSIDDAAFFNCDLTSITIPNSVTSIGDSVFLECRSLKNLTIPNSVINIGSSAFSGCTALTKVTLPNNVTSIGSQTFWGCSSLTSIIIPNGVTKISEHMFGRCSALNSVIIPTSVTSIDGGAFLGCSALTSINMPDSVTSIEWSVFDGCSALTGITIPKSVTMIDDYTFCGCSALKNIVIPDSVTSIGEGAFLCCSNLTSITIPGNVTSIGRYAFNECDALSSVIISDGVTNIDAYAFAGCNTLADVRLPDSITSIKEGVFAGCGFTGITLPKSITSIEKGAFYACSSLENVTIPNRVISIGELAFARCFHMTNVTIPASVKNIGEHVFSNGTLLMDWDLGEHPVVEEDAAYASRRDDTLTDLNYCGSEQQWTAVSLGKEAIPSKTTIHYNAINPSVTADISVSAPKYNTLQLSWKAMPDAKFYEIYSSTTPNFSSARRLGKTKKTTYKFSRAKCGTEYYFWIVPVDSKKQKGTPSEMVSGCTVLEGTPAIQVSRTTYNKVTLKWTKVQGARRYIVEYSASPDAPDSEWRAFPAKGGTSYTVKGVPTGATYYYRVKALRDGYITEASDSTSATTKLAAISNLKVKQAGTNELRISWKKVPGVAYYSVYRYDKEADAYVLVSGAEHVTKNSYLDTGLQASTTYSYKVIGVTKEGRTTNRLEQMTPVSQTTKAPKVK